MLVTLTRINFSYIIYTLNYLIEYYLSNNWWHKPECKKFWVIILFVILKIYIFLYIFRRSTRMRAKRASECSEFTKNHNPNAHAAHAPGARSTPITTYWLVLSCICKNSVLKSIFVHSWMDEQFAVTLVRSQAPMASLLQDPFNALSAAIRR